MIEQIGWTFGTAVTLECKPDAAVSIISNQTSAHA
jgi:hypothetical protein